MNGTMDLGLLALVGAPMPSHTVVGAMTSQPMSLGSKIGWGFAIGAAVLAMAVTSRSARSRSLLNPLKEDSVESLAEDLASTTATAKWHASETPKRIAEAKALDAQAAALPRSESSTAAQLRAEAAKLYVEVRKGKDEEKLVGELRKRLDAAIVEREARLSARLTALDAEATALDAAGKPEAAKALRDRAEYVQARARAAPGKIKTLLGRLREWEADAFPSEEIRQKKKVGLIEQEALLYEAEGAVDDDIASLVDTPEVRKQYDEEIAAKKASARKLRGEARLLRAELEGPRPHPDLLTRAEAKERDAQRLETELAGKFGTSAEERWAYARELEQKWAARGERQVSAEQAQTVTNLQRQQASCMKLSNEARASGDEELAQSYAYEASTIGIRIRGQLGRTGKEATAATVAADREIAELYGAAAERQQHLRDLQRRREVAADKVAKIKETVATLEEGGHTKEAAEERGRLAEVEAMSAAEERVDQANEPALRAAAQDAWYEAYRASGAAYGKSMAAAGNKLGLSPAEIDDAMSIALGNLTTTDPRSSPYLNPEEGPPRVKKFLLAEFRRAARSKDVRGCFGSISKKKHGAESDRAHLSVVQMPLVETEQGFEERQLGAEDVAAGYGGIGSSTALMQKGVDELLSDVQQHALTAQESKWRRKRIVAMSDAGLSPTETSLMLVKTTPKKDEKGELVVSDKGAYIYPTQKEIAVSLTEKYRKDLETTPLVDENGKRILDKGGQFVYPTPAAIEKAVAIQQQDISNLLTNAFKKLDASHKTGAVYWASDIEMLQRRAHCPAEVARREREFALLPTAEARMQYLHEEDPIRLLEARGVVVDREIANVRQVAALERVEAEDLATSPRGELFYVTMADETGEPKRYVAIRDWVMKKKNQAAIQDLRPLTERENLDLRLRKIDEKEWSSVRAIEKLRPFPRELTSGPSGALTGVMVPGRKGGDIGRYQDVRFVEPGATSVYARPFGPKEMAIQNEYMLAQAALDEERIALDLYYRRVGRPDKTVNRDGVDVFVRGTPANQHEGLKLEAEKLLRAAEDIETRSLEPIVDELIRNADPEARASAQRSLAEMKDQAERARELGRQKEASRMEIMSKRLKDRPDSSPSPAEKALLASTSELYKRAHTIERNVRQELATTLRGKLEATFQSLRTETEKLRAKAQAAKTEAARAKADAQAQAAEAALRSVEANRSGLSQIESFARAKADSDRIKAHKKLDEASRIEHAEANPDKIKSMSRRADQARAKYQEVLDDLAAAERRMRAEELERAPERAAERKDLREFLREFCREQLLKGAPATPEVQRWQRGEGHLERWAPELEKLEAAERAEAAEAAAAEATARALAAEAAEVDRAEALAKAERGPERPYQLDLSKLAPVKRVDPERAKAIRVVRHLAEVLGLHAERVRWDPHLQAPRLVLVPLAQVAQAKAASPPPAAVVEAVVAAEASPVSPVPTEQMPVVELVEVVTEPVKVKKPRASRAKKPPKD